MANIERAEALSDVSRRPLSLLREIEASTSEHGVWEVALLRCLSAGWASRGDLCSVLPVIAVAETARRDGFALLAPRLGEEAGAVAGSATEEDTFGEAVAACCTELRSPPLQPVAVPTFAKYFVQQYQTFCGEGGIAEVAAFLLVSHVVAMRMQAALIEAFMKQDVTTATAFNQFKPHDVVTSLEDAVARRGAGRSGALAHHSAIEHALSLYLQLFEDLYQGMRFERMSAAFNKIQARVSLETDAEPPIALYPGVGEIMCKERDDKRDIQFSVERYPCTSETLDPRVVRIPPGKTNNRHKHAHETLFYFIEGTGRILVGTTWVPVKPGDAVFAPRWAIHQTHNTGTTELVLLAITDYYLTSQVYVGKYDKI